LTKAQSIVNQAGVLFGPGKAKNHFSELQKRIEKEPILFQSIVPPTSFGTTVQTLLENGIVYKNKKDFQESGGSVVRNWSLKDFMEGSTWPMDSSGGGSRMVRFGLPVLEDDEDSSEEGLKMISAPPELADSKFISKADWDAQIAKEEKEREDLDNRNPYVKKIRGPIEMHDIIVKEEKDCVLFLSATYCRTCKSLNPKFTSLARRSMEKCNKDKEGNVNDANYDSANDGTLFAKADTTGDVGKDLGRLLRVDAVPAFVLFRKGRRFGPTLSISNIPSKKLAAALDLLESGLDWDSEVIRQAETNS